MPDKHAEDSPAIEFHDVAFGWSPQAPVLRIPQLTADSGKSVFIRGASGSGKSTLLGLIAGVLTPNTGSLHVLGEDMTRLSPLQRDKLRANHMGVIFQMFNLLPYLSVGENILLPCRFSRERRSRIGQSSGEIEAEGQRLANRLGLDSTQLWNRRAADLSVGQQQRVAAARALIGRPELIIADEPTSSLDARACHAFITLLMEETTAARATLIMVSHDERLASHFDIVLDMETFQANAREARS